MFTYFIYLSLHCHHQNDSCIIFLSLHCHHQDYSCVIFLSLHCHHQNDSCVIFLSLHCHHQNDSFIKMGSDESHSNVSLIVRDKMTRQETVSTNHNPFEEKGEPKRYRTEVPLLTSCDSLFCETSIAERKLSRV